MRLAMNGRYRQHGSLVASTAMYMHETRMMLSGNVNTPKKGNNQAALLKKATGLNKPAAGSSKGKGKGNSESESSSALNDKRINAQILLAERARDVIARIQKVEPKDVKEYKMNKEEALKAKEIATEYQRGMTRTHNSEMAKVFIRTLMAKHAVLALPTEELRQEAMTPVKEEDLPKRERLHWKPPAEFMEIATGLVDPRKKEMQLAVGAAGRTLYPEEDATVDGGVEVVKKKDVDENVQQMIDISKTLASFTESSPQVKKAAKKEKKSAADAKADAKPDAKAAKAGAAKVAKKPAPAKP